MDLSPRAKELMRQCERDGKELKQLTGAHPLLIYDHDGKTEEQINQASQALFDKFMPECSEDCTLAEAVERMLENFSDALKVALLVERDNNEQ